MLGVYMSGESLEVDWFTIRLERTCPVPEVDRTTGEQHALGRRDRTDPKIDVEVWFQSRQLTVELSQELGANAARANEPDRERLAREVETGVRGAQRALHVRRIVHDRDVAL